MMGRRCWRANAVSLHNQGYSLVNLLIQTGQTGRESNNEA